MRSRSIRKWAVAGALAAGAVLAGACADEIMEDLVPYEGDGPGPIVPAWTFLNQPNPGPITGIGVADDGVYNTFLVSTDPDGSWRSQDGATLSFIYRSPALTENIHNGNVAFAPSDPTRAISLEHHGSISRSYDSGRTWQIVGSFAGSRWRALGVSPTNPRHVLAAGDGSLKYTNDIDAPSPTWFDAAGIHPDALVYDLAVDPGIPGTWWGASSDCYFGFSVECPTTINGRGLYFSTNNGAVWQNLLVPGFLIGHPVNEMHGVAVAGDVVFAATNSGLWKCTNCSLSSRSWVQLTQGLLANQPIRDVHYAAGPNGAMIYVATATGVYYRPGINPGNFTRSSGLPDKQVNVVTGVPNESERLWVGYFDGDVYTTSDHGTTGTRITGAQGAYALSTGFIDIDDPSESVLHAGTSCQQGLFEGCVGPGLCVNPFKRVSMLPNMHYTMRVVPDPTSACSLYATEFVGAKRRNGCVTPPQSFPLNPEGSDPDSRHKHGLAVTVDGPETVIYIGTGNGHWPYLQGNPAIWASRNGGTTWIERDLTDLTDWDIDRRSSIFDIEVADDDSYLVMAATFGHEQYPGEAETNPANGNRFAGQGVVLSDDGGDTWELVNTGLDTLRRCGLSADPCSHWVGNVEIVRTGTFHRAYAATLDGVYVMDEVENRTPWRPFGGVHWVESVAVDPDDPYTVFAGTTGMTAAEGAYVYRIHEASGGTITETPYLLTAPGLQPIWAQTRDSVPRFRVRDVLVGETKAYALVEGAGIYRLTGL